MSQLLLLFLKNFSNKIKIKEESFSVVQLSSFIGSNHYQLLPYHLCMSCHCHIYTYIWAGRTQVMQSFWYPLNVSCDCFAWDEGMQWPMAVVHTYMYNVVVSLIRFFHLFNVYQRWMGVIHESIHIKIKHKIPNTYIKLKEFHSSFPSLFMFAKYFKLGLSHPSPMHDACHTQTPAQHILSHIP